MNKRINNNLRAEIGYTDIVNYDDIEIKYNKKIETILFFKNRNTIYECNNLRYYYR